MRQATGSNTPQSGNKVSIQLSLDGHSFSVPALSELPAGEAPVTVELLLPGTMLVPGELFDAERGAEMLAANGMPPTAEESVVASDPEAVTSSPHPTSSLGYSSYPGNGLAPFRR